MTMAVTTLDSSQAVTGELNYLDPYSRQSGLFVSPGNHADAGSYRSYVVPIRDGRREQDRFTIEDNGFTLVDQRCPDVDFTDSDAVEADYIPAALEVVRQKLGADLIVLNTSGGWVARMGAAPGNASAQPAAAQVHCDVSPDTGPRRFQELYEKAFPGGQPYRRAVMTSFWRVINEPPQDWPLAVCDFRSVKPHEGVKNPLIWVDELPEDPAAAIAGVDAASANGGSVFYYDPDHEWWYFPGMTRDEALLFTLNDSDHSRAWRCLHSAFRDPLVSAEHTRHSIEMRSVAFFL
jgi:hypothetical protein